MGALVLVSLGASTGGGGCVGVEEKQKHDGAVCLVRLRGEGSEVAVKAAGLKLSTKRKVVPRVCTCPGGGRVLQP